MKTLKITLVTALLFLLTPLATTAQDMFYVHEDVVKPSKIKDYEGILQEFMALVNKHQLKGTKWLAVVTNNSHYLYASPIENMAELDKPSFVAKLIEKEGKEVISDLFNRMDKCYDTELNYILKYDEELSYMPDGTREAPKDKNYRKYHMLYVSPSNGDKVRKNMKAIKELFISKGSKEHYRVYQSGFGTDGEYLMVSIAAKDEMDYARQSNENDELLGDEGKKVLGELMSNLLKYEVMLANIRPDLSYSPE